jgi:Protein kinase domain
VRGTSSSELALKRQRATSAFRALRFARLLVFSSNNAPKFSVSQKEGEASPPAGAPSQLGHTVCMGDIVLDRDLAAGDSGDPKFWALVGELRDRIDGPVSLCDGIEAKMDKPDSDDRKAARLSLRFCLVRDPAALVLAGVLLRQDPKDLVVGEIDFTGSELTPVAEKLAAQLLEQRRVRVLGLRSSTDWEGEERLFGNISAETSTSSLSGDSRLIELLGWNSTDESDDGVLDLDPSIVEVGEVLGQGSFGKVCVCTLRGYPGSFAVKKILLGGPSTGGTTRSAFEAEVLVMKKLRHGSLARIFGAAVDDVENCGLVVMERYSTNLDRLISDRRRLVEDGVENWFKGKEVRTLTSQLWCAVSYLHASSISHGDIKVERSNIPSSHDRR